MAGDPDGGNSLVELGEGIWALKKLFFLGAGQTTGLTYTGLKERLLSSLDAKPWVLDGADGRQESTGAELEQEATCVSSLRSGADVPFPLDTTMTIVVAAKGLTGGNGRPCLVLISPVPVSFDIVAKVRRLAQACCDDRDAVGAIVCPNLQHWLFASQWKDAFKAAKLFVAPAAQGEDVAEKLNLAATVLSPGFANDVCEELEGKLLDGAPTAMNEVVFLHKPSETVVASDSAYTGYAADAGLEQQPSWFARLWFKLTKPTGSFRNPELPVYRTHRVVATGDADAVVRCLASMTSRWGACKELIGAHGSVPHHDEGGAMNALTSMWTAGLAEATIAVAAAE